jgi:hypothetical protein
MTHHCAKAGAEEPAAAGQHPEPDHQSRQRMAAVLIVLAGEQRATGPGQPDQRSDEPK